MSTETAIAQVGDTVSTETAIAQVGDTVRIGKGRKLWRVESLWDGGDRTLARLVPLEGYTATSAETERLVIIERAGE